MGKLPVRHFLPVVNVAVKICHLRVDLVTGAEVVTEYEAAKRFGNSSNPTFSVGEAMSFSAVVVAAAAEEEAVAAELTTDTHEDIWVDTCPESAVFASHELARGRHHLSSPRFPIHLPTRLP